MRTTRATAGDPTLVMALVVASLIGAVPLDAQVPVETEVRQLVTFRILPGEQSAVLEIYHEQLIPLYEQDEAMLSLRAFREVESPVALDLILVRAFRSMAGMDESNSSLRTIAADAGVSVGRLYGEISALSTSHDDQFVEMVPGFENGDPSAKRLVVLEWYRAAPGQSRALLEALERDVLPMDIDTGTPTSTGRFLVTDGWDYLRFMGFDSLGAYQAYRAREPRTVNEHTAVRRQVIVSPVPGLSIR